MMDISPEREFDGLLDYLKRVREFDFTAYKRLSLMRRVRQRMHAVEIDQFADYTDYLEVHPDEFAQLFNAILINVTSFFRDELSWTFLRDAVLPTVLTSASAADPVRVWSAGCASGEETYSIAMLLAESLGRDGFHERVRIYATDIDDEALTQARAAIYSEKQVQSVPPALRDAYFIREGDRFAFDHELRRSVIFGRHDLTLDAPISRVNILVCRNTLMYFNTETQSRILARFHFALAETGVLFLGRAEVLSTHGHLFTPVDLRRRIFGKVPKDHWRERMAILSQANSDDGSVATANRASLYPAAFDASPHAQFIIDAAGQLAFYNEQAGALFRLTPNDVGRPMEDLDLSSRRLDLRPPLRQAIEQRRPISIKELAWEAPGQPPRYFDVQVVSLVNGAGPSLGASISFSDVTRLKELQFELNRSKQDLETAYEELRSTNEELETTNEELQSTVEELEATNEELQSTNEELETTNEELQSNNEELQAINEELRKRSEDLNGANGFLESVLTGVRSGVAVLDRELHVIAWNHRAEDLWGVRVDEVRNQNFLNLDIGLPADQLRPGIRACLNGDSDYSETVLAATNRRGKTISCRVTGTPLLGSNRERRGVILLMDEQPDELVNRA
jgi:two-component system CheB/CheR fusion protein